MMYTNLDANWANPLRDVFNYPNYYLYFGMHKSCWINVFCLVCRDSDVYGHNRITLSNTVKRIPFYPLLSAGCPITHSC